MGQSFLGSLRVVKLPFKDIWKHRFLKGKYLGSYESILIESRFSLIEGHLERICRCLFIKFFSIILRPTCKLSQEKLAKGNLIGRWTANGNPKNVFSPWWAPQTNWLHEYAPTLIIPSDFENFPLTNNRYTMALSERQSKQKVLH